MQAPVVCFTTPWPFLTNMLTVCELLPPFVSQTQISIALQALGIQLANSHAVIIAEPMVNPILERGCYVPRMLPNYLRSVATPLDSSIPP